MKTILCYGDSNTWGYDARSATRLPPDVRWPGVLRNSLGPDYWVIEEGLNGRTTVWDDPISGEWKNGLRLLLPLLQSHAPLDLVVMLLGTNDLKQRFSVPASDIAAGLERLIQVARTSDSGPAGRPPQLLLIAPPPVTTMNEYAEMFAGSLEKSQKLGFYYRQTAELFNTPFLDAGAIIQSWDVDGIHLAPEMHQILGRRVAEIIQQEDLSGYKNL